MYAPWSKAQDMFVLKDLGFGKAQGFIRSYELSFWYGLIN